MHCSLTSNPLIPNSQTPHSLLPYPPPLIPIKVIEGPYSTCAVGTLLCLLDHEISEVREGVLLGCLRAVDFAGKCVDVYINTYIYRYNF